MFRIKPTRNQTTAKHTNLSPYPNNKLILPISKLQQKTQSKAQILANQKLGASNQNKDKISNLSKVINPQKPKENPGNTLNKQNGRVLLKKADNTKDHKIKVQTSKKIQVPSNLSKNNKVPTTFKKQPLASIAKRKSSALGKKVQIVQKVQVPQKSQKIEKKEIVLPKVLESQNEVKKIPKYENAEPKVEVKPKIYEQKQAFPQNFCELEVKSHQKSINLPEQSQKSPQNQKKTILKHEQPLIAEEKTQKQKQMEELMIKIQKRRQARQLQKKRLKEIQEKRKQNEERAMEFLNARSQQGGSQEFQGVTGMLKLNDQLMHFSLAETIMDLQIKKLLKTNFDDFPNKTQIKYQIEQLERINTSYEMIRDDPNNPLKNGLQNYRVQIFNKIGDLIMQAQQGGYSNPNFHILEHDGRINNGPNSLIPQAVRGLPEEALSKFIKFEENEEEDECTICLGEIKRKQVCAHVECGHRFHSNCIKEWVKSSGNCPTCRFNIKFGTKAR